MGTRCQSETRASSLNSPTRCLSPSRGFSDGEAADNEDAGNPVDFDVCRSMKDVTAPHLPLTQKKRLLPYYGVHQDKEALLEQVLALLNAFQDQKFHFRAHKMHHHAVNAVHRKLESQIEFLETSGLEAARTGTLTKLKSKLKGAKFRITDLEMTSAANSVEVARLRVHAQVMKTQEVTVQREEFATEVRRLQKSIRHLRKLHKKVSDDNKEVARLKEEIPMLTAKKQELETSIAKMSKSVQEMTTELAEWKAKEVAAQYARAADDQRLLSLQGEKKSLMDLLLAEKLAQGNFTTIVNELAHQVRVVERETREKETLEREAALSSA